MRNNSKKIIIGIIIIVIVIIAIICMMSLNKKKIKIKTKNETPESYNIELTNKFAENENVKISIDNVAYAEKYLIIDYTIKAKNEDEPYFMENYAEKNEFGFYINRNIKIDGKIIETKKDYSDQISYKISDTEAKIYDIIEIEDLPDKFDLEVKIFENDNTVYEEYEEVEDITEDSDEEEQDDEADEELVEGIDPDEYYNSSDERESVSDDAEYDEYTDESEEFDEEEELDEEEVYEEVEGYYDGTEEKEENEEDLEILTEELGTIKTKATKEELIKNVTVEDYDENYEENNISIKNQKIIKTPFKTFIIVDTTITEVHYQDVESKLVGDPYRYKIDVQDKNGNSINVNQTQEVTVTDEDEKDIYDLEIDGDNIPNNLIAIIKTIIILSDDAKDKIMLQPYYYSYNFPNDDIETAMQNKEWFKVEDDEYEYIEENSNGGEITIAEIEEKNNQILFHYTKKGFVPDAESIVLIRNSTKEFNVFYPDIVKRKGINSDENIVGYNIKNNTSHSYSNGFDEEDMGNVKDLEFTLLEGLEIEKIGEGFSIEI